jgi:hypothetical protein
MDKEKLGVGKIPFPFCNSDTGLQSRQGGIRHQTFLNRELTPAEYSNSESSRTDLLELLPIILHIGNSFVALYTKSANSFVNGHAFIFVSSLAIFPLQSNVWSLWSNV